MKFNQTRAGGPSEVRRGASPSIGYSSENEKRMMVETSTSSPNSFQEIENLLNLENFNQILNQSSETESNDNSNQDLSELYRSVILFAFDAQMGW
jgi:hypothetical protein